MKFLADLVLDTFESHRFAGRASGERSTSKRVRGHKSHVMRFSWLTLGQHQKVQTQAFMRFRANVVFESGKQGFAGRCGNAKLSVERGYVDRGPHEGPGRFCS